MLFIYWSNKDFYKQEKLIEIEADGILEADKKFEEKLGFSPMKTNWVGCQIITDNVASD